MRVVIFGDTHLGRRNFKINEREKDFEDAFRQVIDYSVENADLVIHAGDLFDVGRPSIETIIFAISELKRLKDKGVPFFVIAGSHDIGVEGSFLKVLDRIGLVINLSDKKYYAEDGDKIVLKGEERKGVFVAGLPGRKSRINEVLELLKPELPKVAFKIFLFHHIIEDISPLFSEVKKSCLPKGFDLYVSGHWHDFFESVYDSRKILYPGSTENCDFRDMQNDKRGFIVFDTGSNNYEFRVLKTRRNVIERVDCSGLSPDEVSAELLKKVGDGDDSMLFFVLTGRLGKGLKNEINKESVYLESKKKGYLFCKVYTGGLENPEEKQTSAGKKSVDEIEREFFKNKGLSDDEIRIAGRLIRDLGADSQNSAQEKMISIVIKWLEDEEL